MKRIKIIVPIIIVFVIVLLAAVIICSSTAAMGGYERISSTSIIDFTLKNTMNNSTDIISERIPASRIVDNHSGNGISIIFPGEETIYYLQCMFSKDSIVPDTINCYEYDLALCSSKLVYSASDERCCSKDYYYIAGKIFYVICAENNIRIEYYDLNASERICIEYFDNDHIPSLFGSGDYITWYVLDGEQLLLYGYQVSTGCKFLISDNIVAFNAETVAYVNDNRTVYITRAGEEYTINLYDLVYQKVIQRYRVANKTMISKILANKDYLVFTDVIGPAITNCSLNVIRLEDGSVYSITIKGKSVEVYDFILNGDTLSVSSYENNKSQSNAWVVYDLDLRTNTASEYVVENSIPGILIGFNNKTFLLDSISGDVVRLR